MWHVRFQFPDQGWNPYPRHGKHRVPTTGTPGKSPDISFISCPSWAFPEVQELIRSDFTQFKKKKKKKILQDLQVGEQSLKESGPAKMAAWGRWRRSES